MRIRGPRPDQSTGYDPLSGGVDSLFPAGGSGGGPFPSQPGMPGMPPGGGGGGVSPDDPRGPGGMGLPPGIDLSRIIGSGMPPSAAPAPPPMGGAAGIQMPGGQPDPGAAVAPGGGDIMAKLAQLIASRNSGGMR